MRVEREIEIGAPPAAVYDLVMDPRRLADWVTIHVGIKSAPDGKLEEGSELTQCLKIAGRRFDVRWTVAEADRPASVVWEGRGPVRSRAKAVYGFTQSGNGTSFSYLNEFHTPGGPLAKVADRVLAGTAEREADRSLSRLKALLES